MPQQQNDDDDNIDETITPPGPPPITVTPEDADDDDADEQPQGQRQDKRTRDATGKWTKGKQERAAKARGGDPDWKAPISAIETKIQSLIEGNSRDREALLAAVLGRQQGSQQQAAPQVSREAAAIETELKSIDAQLDAELKLMQANPAHPPTRYRELQRQEQRLNARLEFAEQRRDQPQQQERSGVDPEKAARLVVLKGEFSWLASNPGATQAANGFRLGLLRAGRPDNIDTDREACAMAARFMNLSPAAAPSARTRQAFGGAPSGQRAAAGGGRRMDIPAQLVEGSGLSQAQLARALYPEE